MKKSGFKRLTYEEAVAKQASKRLKSVKKLKNRVQTTPHHKLTGNRANLKKSRRKKTERKKLEERIWALCRQIVKMRYGDTCFTCGASNLEGRNWQCGHGKPNGALSLRYKYDIRNLRPQCFHDNMQLGGLQDIFIARLERDKEGLEFLQEACVKENGEWKIKRIPPMGSMEAYEFLVALEEKYKSLTTFTH